jgi:hypothetical protein
MTIGLYFGGAGFSPTFGNDLGNIELDAVLDEEHNWKADVTSNPVEEGAPITDHIRELADEFRLRCFVSDAPLTLSQTVAGQYNSGTSGTRTQPMFDLLNALIKAREVVTVYTKHAIYSDMAITEVSIPRGPQDGEALEFTVSFRVIRTVATETVAVPAGISAKPAAKQGGATGRVAKKAAPAKAAGKKQAATATKPTAVEKLQSTLSKWFN